METKKNPGKELNNKRVLFFQIGLLCSLSLSIAMLSWAKPEIKPAQLLHSTNVTYSDVNDLPPVTSTPEPLSLTQISVAVNSPYINVKANTDPIEIPTTIFVDPGTIDGYDPNRTYGPGGATGGSGNQPLVPDNDFPVVFAEQMPMFDGGDGQTAFSAWCQENLKYPVAAVDNGAQGKVYISFIVEANGKLSKIEIKRSSGNKYLDKAAMDIVSQSPNRWSAAKNNGRTVRFQYIMPVEFSLEN